MLKYLVGGIAIAAAVIAGSLAYTFGPNPPFWIKSEIVQSLIMSSKDPDALKFENLRYSSNDPDIVCGLVNQKNEIGVYTGYKRFAFIRSENYTFIDDTNPTMMVIVMRVGCY